MKRRAALRFGAGIVLAFGIAPLSRAQDPAASWPAKTVRLIIPFTTGGSTDFQGRLLCDWLSRHFGQQFVIDHKPWSEKPGRTRFFPDGVGNPMT